MHIMSSTGQNSQELYAEAERTAEMELSMEKVYKTMNSAGIFNLVIGILVIVAGSLTGSFLITMGAKLLHRKKDIIF